MRPLQEAPLCKPRYARFAVRAGGTSTALRAGDTLVAIAHLDVRAHSRTHGHSVAAAVAYRLGLTLIDERTGREHNYSRRSGVAGRGFAYGTHAPGWSPADPQAFANALESTERRRNSTIARDIEVSLPHELTDTQRESLATAWAGKLASTWDAPVAWAIHRPDRRGNANNHHLHCLMSTRALDDSGQLGKKLRALDDRKTGPERIVEMRFQWQDLCNAHLARADCTARIWMGRLAEHEIRLPHLGPRLTAMERNARQAQGIPIDGLSVERMVSTGTCVTKRGQRLADAYAARIAAHPLRQPTPAPLVPEPQAPPPGPPEPIFEAQHAQPSLIPDPAPAPRYDLAALLQRAAELERLYQRRAQPSLVPDPDPHHRADGRAAAHNFFRGESRHFRAIREGSLAAAAAYEKRSEETPGTRPEGPYFDSKNALLFGPSPQEALIELSGAMLRVEQETFRARAQALKDGEASAVARLGRAGVAGASPVRNITPAGLLVLGKDELPPVTQKMVHIMAVEPESFRMIESNYRHGPRGETQAAMRAHIEVRVPFSQLSEKFQAAVNGEREKLGLRPLHGQVRDDYGVVAQNEDRMNFPLTVMLKRPRAQVRQVQPSRTSGGLVESVEPSQAQTLIMPYQVNELVSTPGMDGQLPRVTGLSTLSKLPETKDMVATNDPKQIAAARAAAPTYKDVLLDKQKRPGERKYSAEAVDTVKYEAHGAVLQQSGNLHNSYEIELSAREIHRMASVAAGVRHASAEADPSPMHGGQLHVTREGGMRVADSQWQGKTGFLDCVSMQRAFEPEPRKSRLYMEYHHAQAQAQRQRGASRSGAGAEIGD